MNIKEVDRISAEFAVSLSQAHSLVASWMGDAVADDSGVEEDETAGFHKLPTPRAGLGSKASADAHEANFRREQATGNMGHAYKALNAVKRKVTRKPVPEPAVTGKPAKAPAQVSDDSDSDTGRSRISTTKKNKASFLDSYKGSKKQKRGR